MVCKNLGECFPSMVFVIRQKKHLTILHNTDWELDVSFPCAVLLSPPMIMILKKTPFPKSRGVHGVSTPSPHRGSCLSLSKLVGFVASVRWELLIISSCVQLDDYISSWHVRLWLVCHFKKTWHPTRIQLCEYGRHSDVCFDQLVYKQHCWWRCPWILFHQPLKHWGAGTHLVERTSPRMVTPVTILWLWATFWALVLP